MEASSVFNCSVCIESDILEERNRIFDGEDSLWSHIAVVHVGWIAYECVLCPLILIPSDGVLKQHYGLVHPGRMPRAVYTYDEKKKLQVRRILSESKELATTTEQDQINLASIIRRNEMGFQSNNSEDTIQNPALEIQRSQSPQFMLTSHRAPTVTYKRRKPKKPKSATVIVKRAKSETVPFDPQNSMNASNDITSSLISSTLPADDQEPAPILQKEQEAEISIKKEPISSASISSKDGLPWCRICDKQLDQKNGKKIHIWSAHMPHIRRFSCNQCDYSSNISTEIKLHCKIQHNSKNSWTDDSRNVTPNYRRLYKAAFREREQKPAVFDTSNSICYLCEKTLQNHQRSNHIWRTHMSEHRFSCNLCEMTSPFAQNMRSHSTWKHPEQKATVCWTDRTGELWVEFERLYARSTSSAANKNPSSEGDVGEEKS